MPLLKEVKETESGLVGITEDDERVPLGKPTPGVERLYSEVAPSTAIKLVIGMARSDPDFFYEITERGIMQAIYNKYPKSKYH